jgi:hypothetical protein
MDNNNVLMHNNRDVDKITRSICLKWKVEDFGEGIIGGFVIDTEGKWSFYWSMRRKTESLDNIEMIFDNIAVMIFPAFATAPVCKGKFDI